ncbi:MAG: efflux RND transporter periplasmic adaptor subunit [Flavobacteriaceae bacterium]|nr:efflux RND transporter periplasmic adaptor subunit [Flavobacteriaceae bacterium]
MKNKIIKTIVSVLAILGICIALFLILQMNKKSNEEKVAIVAEKNTDVAVRTALVQSENISGAFQVNGTFLPNKQAQISAEMGGQLIALNVREGSYVRAGQSIGRLGGEKVNVNVSAAKANLDNAQMTLNRYEQAFQTGGITALQLDQARLQVKNAKSQLQSAQLVSGDTNIISKVSGIVNQKFVEVGTVVGPGTPIVEVVDISSLKLKVDVDQSLISKLGLGQTVQILPDVATDTLSGKITFIAPSSSGALKFPVEINISNPGAKLKAGMYGTAIFDQSAGGNVLTVPREAFVGSVSDNRVFVVRNNTALITQVQSGVNYGDRVEIISGLQAGDEVVTSGQINLIDQTKVRVIK